MKITVPTRWFPGVVETTTAKWPDARPRGFDTDPAVKFPVNATTQTVSEPDAVVARSSRRWGAFLRSAESVNRCTPSKCPCEPTALVAVGSAR